MDDSDLRKKLSVCDKHEYGEYLKLAFSRGVLFVKSLIEKHNFDPSRLENGAIRYASENGQDKFVSLLLEDKRVDPSADNNYAIRWAFKNGHIKVVSLLLKDKRVDPSLNNNYAIRWTSQNGHDKVVSLLLKDKRVDPSTDNNYAIRWASQNGHDKVLSLLLKDKRVDPSADNNHAIRWALKNGHDKVFSLLLKDKRVDPSADNNYAIRWASNNGHDRVVSLLLKDKKVDPSTDNNYIKVVSLLLKDERVDPSADNNRAFRWATTLGRDKVVSLLLQDKRIDPSAEIQWASENGHVKVVSLLLQGRFETTAYVNRFPTSECEHVNLFHKYDVGQKSRIFELISNLKGKMIYTGGLKECKFHGFGKLFKLSRRLIVKPKETLFYEGNWRGGKKHGGGKLYGENGKIQFYGNFVNDKKEGFGILFDEEGKITKRGKFKENKLIESIPLNFEVNRKEIEDEKLMKRIKSIVFSRDIVRKRFLLGKGNNAEVYKVDPKFAFKYFPGGSVPKENKFKDHIQRVLDQITSEIFVIDQLNHPNIMKVFGVSVDNPMGILMELCEMSVVDLISDAESKRLVSGEETEHISFRDKLIILFETASALEFLHMNLILHRDLKVHFFKF